MTLAGAMCATDVQPALPVELVNSDQKKADEHIHGLGLPQHCWVTRARRCDAASSLAAAVATAPLVPELRVYVV